MPRIFISYRREDSAGYAGRLYDRLVNRFGKDLVFMDIDSIKPGQDFVAILDERLSACDVLIALIGRHWLTVADERGRRRIDNPRDYVRMEISAAARRGVRIVPGLVGGARMPGEAEMPETMIHVVRQQGVEISDGRFHQDVDRLIDELEALDREAGRPAGPSSDDQGGQAASGRPRLRFERSRTLQVASSPACLGLAYGPDGNWLATGQSDGTVRAWDVVAGTPVELDKHAGAVCCIRFSADGTRLASTGIDAVHVWDMATRRLESRFESPTKLLALAFCQGGRRLAGGGYGSSIGIWDLDRRARVADHASRSEVIHALATGPDDAVVAAAGSNGAVAVLDTSTGNERAHVRAHDAAVYVLGFSQDGRMLATAGRDTKVRLWNTERWTVEKSLKQPSHAVLDIAFHPDGRVLATGSANGVIRLWQIATATLLQEIEASSSAINGLAFSPDGRTLAAGGGDGTVTLWAPAEPWSSVRFLAAAGPGE